MFACIHVPDHAIPATAVLLECARAFSPSAEITGPNTTVFSVNGLDLFYSNPSEIAHAIAARIANAGMPANVAVARTADAAILAARWLVGVTVLPDKTAGALARLQVNCLPLSPEMHDTLERWGINTFGELASLPETGIAERLGLEAVKFQQMARGAVERPLVIPKPEISYEDHVELDHPVELLEPLMFVLGRSLNELCGKMQSNGMAAEEVRLLLELEGKDPHKRTLRLPFPIYRSMVLLKLVQMDLEGHPPQAPVIAVSLLLRAVPSRKTQGGLFVPLAPEPDKLEVTLARIRALVGDENIGVPELLNTHRPDAFRLVKFPDQYQSLNLKSRISSDKSKDIQSNGFTNSKSEISHLTARVSKFRQEQLPYETSSPPKIINFKQQNPDFKTQSLLPTSQISSPDNGSKNGSENVAGNVSVPLAFRYFRPPLEARVDIEQGRPIRLSAAGIRGKITTASGPWRSSGDWWTNNPWTRDEWDVCLSGGALYRIYCVPPEKWFVEGSYD